ncbi:MAG: cystathionine beta-lyase [Acidimicrobiales bacterium]|nr:MAG: cystathionine beta-lyase [Acidimicrobiales bacterium]
MTHDTSALGPSTRAIHAGTRIDPQTGATVEPIYQCSVYAQTRPGEFINDYGRSMSANFKPLEVALAAVEEADHAVVVSSGVGAMTCLLGLLKSGDRLVMPIDVYGGTYRLFKEYFENFGIEIVQVDMTDLAAVEAAMTANARMLYIETPTNPLLVIYDLRALADIAKKHNATSVVDNTFASPYFQKPLNHGIDVVLHSCSKYLGGHSDIVGGSLMTNDLDTRTALDHARKSFGVHADPFTMFLLRRSIKTLPVRMERHQSNAMAVAQYLESHKLVTKVIYPGLPSHPQHELAKKQMSGFAGMMSVYFDLPFEPTKTLISSFDVFTLAESLGAVESLVEHPSSMTHAKIPADVREKHGLTDGLVRFSIGIEDVDDIIADLDRALAKVAK